MVQAAPGDCMPQPCRVCTHEAYYAIDSALLDGVATAVISETYGLTASAIGRHRRAHLLAGKRAAVVVAREKVPTKRTKKAACRVAEKAVAATQVVVYTTPTGDAPPEVQDDPAYPKNPERDWVKRGRKPTLEYLAEMMLDIATDSKAKGDMVTATIAADKAANLVLRLEKQYPEKVTGDEVADSQEELLALIKAAKAPVAIPSADWEVL